MMRLVLMGVGAFLLSLGGTTGALVMKAKAHPALADSLAAHTDPPAAHTDSAAHPKPAIVRPDSSPAPADTGAARLARHDSAGATASTAALGASPVATKPAAAPAAAPAATEAKERAAYKELARIFANMKTTDAAKVLGYPSDTEVEGVLQQLGVRPAAGLLAALPKERAAALISSPSSQQREGRGHAVKPVQSSVSELAGDLLPAFASKAEATPGESFVRRPWRSRCRGSSRR